MQPSLPWLDAQCSANHPRGGFATVDTIGLEWFTIQLLFFTPGFDGAKTVYEEANELSASSGWVSRGNWTVQ